MDQLEEEFCKYCGSAVQPILSEHMKCAMCTDNVHLKCLQKGAVPGGLCGDVFYIFTCQECSPSGSETFEREKMPWYKVLIASISRFIH